MMKFAFLFFLVTAHLATAATFTPEEAALYALKHNRELNAARLMIAEAEGRLLQAGLWRNPEFDASVMRGRRRTDYSVGLMQRFPIAGRLEKARQLGRVDVAAAVAEFEVERLRLTAEVLRSARLVLVREARIRVLRDQRTLLRELHEQTTRLIAAGEAKGSDPLAAELEIARLDLDEGVLQMEQVTALQQLNTLMGRDATALLVLRGALPTPPSTATFRLASREAIGRRPDRRLAVLLRDRAAAEEALARASRWEDPAIGLDLTREEEMNMVGLKVSIPLPLWDRQQGAIQEARAGRLRRQAGVRALDLTISNEIQEARRRLEASLMLKAKATGPMRELAMQTTRLVLQAYSGGGASLLEVMESRRQSLALRLRALEMESLFVEAYTDWEWRAARFPLPANRAARSKD